MGPGPRACEHTLGRCRVGPPCAPDPPPAPPPTGGSIPADLCNAILFAKTRRNGTLGGQWCSGVVPATANFSSAHQSLCESTYIDPVDGTDQSPYPGDCSGTCRASTGWTRPTSSSGAGSTPPSD
jgi:hypothetical protein